MPRFICSRKSVRPAGRILLDSTRRVKRGFARVLASRRRGYYSADTHPPTAFGFAVRIVAPFTEEL